MRSQDSEDQGVQAILLLDREVIRELVLYCSTSKSYIQTRSLTTRGDK